MAKKSKKQLKIDRQISRDRRNTLRREIKDAVLESYLDGTCHFIFIVSETKNMERILLTQKRLPKSGSVLTLPILTKEMIEQFPKKNNISYLDYIEYYYGLTASFIEPIKGTKLFVVKGLTKLSNFKSMVEISVRPYNEYTWLSDAVTSLNGYRILGSNQLKRYFVLDKKYPNLYVYQDTITMLGIYKAAMGKIDEGLFMADYALKEKYAPGNILVNDNALMTLFDVELMKKLANESSERRELILTRYNKSSNIKALPEYHK